MNFSNIGRSAMARIFIIGFLILLLLIPVEFVRGLINERMYRYNDAVTEISSRWGGPQTIQGPVIMVPFQRVTARTKEKVEVAMDQAYFLPEELGLDADLQASTRKRSIYKAVLYSVDLNIKGNFVLPQSIPYRGEITHIYWDQAAIVVGIPDTRGVKDQLKLQWNGMTRDFLPGTAGSEVFGQGLHVPLDLTVGRGGRADFAFSLRLQGSSYFYITPVGKSTVVTMKSNWADPGFTGSILPDKHNITEQGFTSRWSASFFGRGYGQQFVASEQSSYSNLSSSSFGLELVMPVDHYQKSERAVKYAILFLIVTFTGYFLFEIFGTRRIHPVQYLMVGSAMVIFYVLFTSFSEHIDFTLSYSIAALAVILLIGLYTWAILQDRSRALIAGGLMTGLYSYLYVVLTREDTALLLGSVALFTLLAVVMYLTRNVDWYSLGDKKENGITNESGSSSPVSTSPGNK
ncbi:MAG: cell envelope integrity protein CreD [Leptospiraceae bacterium]|nr:cell envelope integrity protein CreD [Leptospiraceae bacterium]